MSTTKVSFTKKEVASLIDALTLAKNALAREKELFGVNDKTLKTSLFKLWRLLYTLE